MDDSVKIAGWQRFTSFEALTYALLFLFPIGGMLVRGWLTNIFNLLFFLGLIYLRKRHQSLLMEERIFLVICGVYVGIFFLSGLANGWGPIQTHELGTELRFWMIIPIYLLVREQRNSQQWLLYGSLVGILFIFTQSVYEVHWQGLATSWGVYSKNIIGPFSVLLGFWILFLWDERNNMYWKALITIAFLLAVLATALSGSRGAYVGFIVTFISWLLFNIRMRWMLVSAILVIGLLALIYQKNTIVNHGVNKAISSFRVYMQDKDIVHSKITMDSTEIHLEMWRAARYFFPDHPILGVGPGNYQATAEKYAQEGKVNPAIAGHGHPHNSFLEALYSKGIIGLISLLLLLYYPFYILHKTRSQSRSSASLGMLHIIGISAFSLFDASPVLFNNYTSILLLGIAVFFSHHLNQMKVREPAHA